MRLTAMYRIPKIPVTVGNTRLVNVCKMGIRKLTAKSSAQARY
jgi:hypothetical protein